MENPQGSTAGIYPVTEQFKINRFIFIFLQPDKFQNTTFIPTDQAAALFQRPILFHTHSHPKIYPKQKYLAWSLILNPVCTLVQINSYLRQMNLQISTDNHTFLLAVQWKMITNLYCHVTKLKSCLQRKISKFPTVRIASWPKTASINRLLPFLLMT